MMDREKQSIRRRLCHLTKGLAALVIDVKGQSLVLGSDWMPTVGRIMHVRAATRCLLTRLLGPVRFPAMSSLLGGGEGTRFWW